MSSEIQQDDVEQESAVSEDLGEFVEDLDETVTDEEVTAEDQSEEVAEDDSETETETDNDEVDEADGEAEGTDEEDDTVDAVEESEPAETTAPEVETVEEEQGLTLQQIEMLEIDEQLVKLNPKVRKAQDKYDSLTKERKKAKENLDELVEEQKDLCNQLAQICHGGYQHKLPFKETPHPDVEAGKHRPHGSPALETVAKEIKKKKVAEDPAKKAAIHDLGLTEAMTDKLMDGGIQFISELEERIRKANMGNFKWHDGITGVAKGSATKIEDALEAWRRDNPVPDPDDDDDEDEELEAVAVDTDEDLQPVDDLGESEEEAGDEVETVWWCCSCDHTWPIDGDNHICPECETNEGGNCHIGFNGCPDADEEGIVKTGYEDVQIVEGEGLSCTVRVYCNQAKLWNSSIIIADGEYRYSNNLVVSEETASTSRSAAILNELGYLIDNNKEIGKEMVDEINDYIDLHLNDVPGQGLECTDCNAVFFSDAEKPTCFHCGGTTLVRNN